MKVAVSELRFTPARTFDVAGGLLGWARFDVGLLRLDGVAVRRTRAGRLTLAYPSRRDRRGREHTLVLPVTHESEQQIETAVLAELRRQGVLP